MKAVGITGGIGSGKTTVARFFEELGIPVYYADEAGKWLLNNSEEVKTKVKNLLGEDAYQDTIANRKYIASRVFNSEENLKKLNEIIHPAVEEDFNKWKLVQNAPYVLYEAAILFETGKYKTFDAVILVTAPYEERIRRLQKRDSSSIKEIEERMKHQWPDEKKTPLASFEIKNTDLSLLKEQVKNLHEILLKAGKN